MAEEYKFDAFDEGAERMLLNYSHMLFILYVAIPGEAHLENFKKFISQYATQIRDMESI